MKNMSLSKSNTRAESVHSEIAEPGNVNRHPAIAPITTVADIFPTAMQATVGTDNMPITAMDNVPSAGRAPSVASHGTDNRDAAVQDRPTSPMAAPLQAMSPGENGPVSPAVVPGQAPLPAPPQVMPLFEYLKLAADQIRALRGMISRQHERWTRQLDTVEKQALLETACQVLFSALQQPVWAASVAADLRLAYNINTWCSNGRAPITRVATHWFFSSQSVSVRLHAFSNKTWGPLRIRGTSCRRRIIAL